MILFLFWLVLQITECIHSTVRVNDTVFVYTRDPAGSGFSVCPTTTNLYHPDSHEDIFILTVYVCIGTILGTFYSWYLKHSTTVF